MFDVIKRSGSIVEFDLSKIKKAIEKAFDACDVDFTTDMIDFITLKVTADFQNKIKDSHIGVEQIQDSVEKVLMDSGYTDVAKAYILYRKERDRLRRVNGSLMDYKRTVDNYLNINDWRVKENSTVTYSLGGLILSNSGAMTANYWLSEIYDDEIANAHKNADIHIHDLSMLSGYCFTGDTIVKSLDGKNRTFKELVDDNVKELWVYSYDTEKQCVVPAKAINPRVTRKTKELIAVTLSDKTVVRSTPDHRFMLRDGMYIEAKDLKPNMSLMPLYIGEKGKYCSINNAWTNMRGRRYLHRWVAEQMTGAKLDSNTVVHHINGDKHDNRPENLEILSDSVHRAMEVRKTMDTDIWRQANSERLKEYNKSDEKRTSVSSFAKSRNRRKNGTFAPSTFGYYEEKDPVGAFYNHRVRKVEKITLDEEIEVYDLTVPTYENFAVADGIFVHNCAGWSLKQLILEGLGGVPGKITSAPARHLSTLCNQMVNFLGILQNEWAG